MALKADTAAKLAKADKDSEGDLSAALAASEEG